MRFTAWLVLFATLLLWSGNWIVARAAREEIGPALATVGRLILVLALLAPFTLRGLIEKLPDLKRRDWGILAALGLTGGGPHLGLQWLGLHYTPATSGILYLSVTPIFILLLRVRHDPLDIAELLTMVCGFGFVYMLPWLAWEITAYEMRLTARGALAVLYSGIGSLLLAYAGWSYVVTRLGAARAGATLHLMPAMGVALSALFLGELPSGYHFAGISLILTGTWVASTR